MLQGGGKGNWENQDCVRTPSVVTIALRIAAGKDTATGRCQQIPEIDADQRRYLPIFTWIFAILLVCVPLRLIWGSIMSIGKGRLLVGLLVAATIWGLVDVRRRGYPYPESPQEHKTDLTVYTGAGGAFFDGRPPYEVRNPRGWTYVYPPILALLLAPLAALPMQDQSTVWFFLCLWMCWGAIASACGSWRWSAVRRTIRPSARRGGLVGWERRRGDRGLAHLELPATRPGQRRNPLPAVVGAAVDSRRAHLSGRDRRRHRAGLAGRHQDRSHPAGRLLLFVQLVGFLRSRWQQPALAAPLGRQLAGSTVGVGLGLALFFFLLPAALIGWNANLRHLDTWNRLVLSSAANSSATPGFENDTHSVRNQCLGNAVYRLGNFGAYMFAGGPEDPMVDDDNPPPRLMDAPASTRACWRCESRCCWA